MNDDFIPENPEGEMPGDNIIKNEKVLGAEARHAVKDAEKLFDKHDRIIQQIHPAIIKVGEKLSVGRELYEYDNNGFNDWIVRNKLDQGRIFGRQQERTAAMTIYRLAVHGEDTGEEGVVPLTLDLTNCKRARPTDIVDWARKDQPKLFEDLRRRAAVKGAKKPAPKDGDESEDEDTLDDAMPDLGGGGVGNDPLIDELRAEIKLLRQRIVELEQENAGLRERLGMPLPAAPEVLS